MLKQSILATIISEQENEDRLSIERKNIYNKEYTDKNEEKNENENNDSAEEFKNNRNSKERSSAGNGKKIRRSKEENLLNIGDPDDWLVNKEFNDNNNLRNKDKDKKKVRRNSKIKGMGSNIDHALHGVISSILSGII